MRTEETLRPSLGCRLFDSCAKYWYRFSSNKLSVFGVVLFLIIILVAAFAPLIAPYPGHAKPFVDFKNANQPPTLQHLFGTDRVGRDIFSRVLFGYRFSLLMAVIVLGISVPFGVTIGLVAGYYKGSWIDTLLMRFTDIFLSVPPLLLALMITAVLKPNLINSMIAITAMWWPLHARLLYGLSSSLSDEYFVVAEQVSGVRGRHILFVEILPNCIGPILTKITLDVGWVILMGATLSFVGLGVQPPKPGLGTMVSAGAKDLPGVWWATVFPALAIVLVVLSCNLIGDGLHDVFAVEEV